MQYLSFILLLVASIAASTNYKNCDEPTKGKMKSFTSARCPNAKDVCHLVKYTKNTITFNFVPYVDSNTVTAVLQAYKMENGKVVGDPETVKYDNANACKSHNLKCPLKKGLTYTYKNTVNVSRPDYDYLSKFMLKDDNGDDIVCFTVPIEYVDHY